MRQLIDLVTAQIDKHALDSALQQLRSLDTELDQKMDDIRVAQQNVTVADRLNIFTNSDAELQLKEENRLYHEIRNEHGRVVAMIKDLIHDAMFEDYRVALKIQTAEVLKSAQALRIRHKWGVASGAHEYKIHGLEKFRQDLGQLSSIVDSHFGFTNEPMDGDILLHLVYDDILRREGFVN